MATFSVLVPLMPRRPRHALAYARLVEQTHAARLWQGQVLLAETHQTFVHLAAAGVRVPAGLGVTLLPMRHPYEAAVQARSVALATGHPVIAGYGPGGRSFQRGLLGEPYRTPLTAVREYASIVRRLLDGGPVDLRGEVFSCQAELPPCPAPRVEVGLGVLRPGMARLAGEIADAAITWLVPASYLREVLVPAIAAGARAAGRPMPRVVAIVPLALAAGGDPIAVVLASNHAHLRAGHYRDMLGRAGIDLPADDPAGMAKAALAGEAFLLGTPDELLAGLQRYFDAGADEVVLNLTGVRSVRGSAAAQRELTELLRLTEPLAGGHGGTTVPPSYLEPSYLERDNV